LFGLCCAWAECGQNVDTRGGSGHAGRRWLWPLWARQEGVGVESLEIGALDIGLTGDEAYAGSSISSRILMSKI